MKNLLPNVKIEQLSPPAAKTATYASKWLDLQGCNGTFSVAIAVGADTGTMDGSNYMTPTFQESDTDADADATAVAAGNILTALPVLNLKATYENKTVVGECLTTKRYGRVLLTETGAFNAIVGITGFATKPSDSPVAYTGSLAGDGETAT